MRSVDRLKLMVKVLRKYVHEACARDQTVEIHIKYPDCTSSGQTPTQPFEDDAIIADFLLPSELLRLPRAEAIVFIEILLVGTLSLAQVVYVDTPDLLLIEADVMDWTVVLVLHREVC